MMRLVFLFFCITSSLFAYLDPSTGSLLLSSVVALFASAIFFVKSVYYKILSVLGGGGLKHDKNVYSLVFYSEGKQYYGVFAPILDVLDEWNQPYLFLTSDKNDPAFSRHIKERIKFIGEGNRAYAYLNTLKADLFVLTTPGLDVLQIKKTKRIKHYSHIVHALRVPNYRTFGIDYFDSVLVNSYIQEIKIRELETLRHLSPKEIFNVGSTYCDFLYDIKQKFLDREKVSFFPNRGEQKVVLLSPSWGKEGILSKYGMRIISPILQNGFLLIIRPHPQSLLVEQELIRDLQSQTQDGSRVVWDIGTPNVYAMQESDVMISDFSGIIFDYLCLYEKPILSVAYDFDNSGYDSADIGGMWEFSILDKIGNRIPSDNLDSTPCLINQALEGGQKRESIQEIKALLWSYPHQAGKRSALILLQIREKILEEKLQSFKEICNELLAIKEILRREKC